MFETKLFKRCDIKKDPEIDTQINEFLYKNRCRITSVVNTNFVVDGFDEYALLCVEVAYS